MAEPRARSLRSSRAHFVPESDESGAEPHSKRCRASEPTRAPVLPSSRRRAASALAEDEEPPAQRRRACGASAASSSSAAANVPRVRLVMRSSCPSSATTASAVFNSSRPARDRRVPPAPDQQPEVASGSAGSGPSARTRAAGGAEREPRSKSGHDKATVRSEASRTYVNTSLISPRACVEISLCTQSGAAGDAGGGPAARTRAVLDAERDPLSDGEHDEAEVRLDRNEHRASQIPTPAECHRSYHLLRLCI
jgi:hypothetical protein